VSVDFLTLREECGLEMFEERVQRRIFRPLSDEIMGGWIMLHKE
jgi:hypothetical protein